MPSLLPWQTSTRCSTPLINRPYGRTFPVCDRRPARLFRTAHGRLDLLKEAGGETFETLTRDAVQRVVLGSELQIASLAAIARMKRAANRPKDRQVLAAIEAELQKRG